LNNLNNIAGSTPNYEFHLKDHLGNTRIAVNQTGEVTQKNNYYPFGMRFRIKNSDNKYLYNGKELQEETDWLDYGARFYMADIGRWGAIDPLAESYSSQSTYHFSGNNPMRFIDFNGMNFDDYFSYTGNFLGSDNASTDNIRIMNTDTWSNFAKSNYDGTETIEHGIGNKISKKLSESGLSEAAELSVYDHYNITGLELRALLNESPNQDAGMIFNAMRKNGLESKYINLPLNALRRQGMSDHANEIQSMFIHENKHLSDLTRLGIDAYSQIPKPDRERSALKTQMDHAIFNDTRPVFQQWTTNYAHKWDYYRPLPITPIMFFPSAPVFNNFNL